MFNLFEKKIWPPNFQNPPWGTAPSIYAHIELHIDPNKPGLWEPGYQLPDEADRGPQDVSFAPGAIDGVMGHHVKAQPNDQSAGKIYAALKASLKSASDKNIATLYSRIKENNAINVIDALSYNIQRAGELDPVRLRDLSLWITTEAPDREPVKVGMALLGLLHGWDDREVFLTLGRHDEFTLYAAVAISNNDAYGEKVLYELAQSAEGWGRISTVERLADATDPEVKDWLIREGFKNDVMYEYLACICARAGALHLALNADVIDDELFQSACEIIDTLVSGEGGPAEGLADYEHGCSAISSLLRHGRGRFETASHYWFLSKLKDRVEAYLNGERKLEQDWSDDGARQILDELNKVLTDPKCSAAILDALENGDEQAFRSASRVSQTFNIDPWPHFFRRTQQGEDYWWGLMRTTGEDRIDDVLSLAEERIPLDTISTGPSDAMGLGSEYLPHQNLDWILQDIGKFPGKGWKFIKAGLQSPVTRNRNFAIVALSAWGQDAWPKEAEALVKAAADAEPESDVKDRFKALLNGEPIS